MRIATWNINGVKARLDTVVTWLKEAGPDLVCLQEIKCVDAAFPTEAFETLGYNVVTHGQKGFNGVAILSKLLPEDVLRGLPGAPEDEQARYLETTVSLPGTALRLCCLYLPNGNPIGTEKFTYKLAWMERLEARARELLKLEMPVVLVGDFNVIPEPRDAKFPQNWTGDALFQPESRAKWRRLLHLGLADATRLCHPNDGVYTFWDYQAGAWQKDDGIRIDHMLLSPQAVDMLGSSGIDKHVRGWEKPSDHVPVWIELDVSPGGV